MRRPPSPNVFFAFCAITLALTLAVGCGSAKGSAGTLGQPDAGEDTSQGEGGGLGDTGGTLILDSGSDGAPTGETGGCVAKTCSALGVNCGPTADGCGGIVNCGSCSGAAVCGATTPNVCGTTCVPQTCVAIGATCGKQGDGCGGVIDCGSCASGTSCGGGGVLNTCGSPLGSETGSACAPLTCASLGINCGPTADGCGGILECGSTCPNPGDICGGGGVPNVCGGGPVPCVAKTCTDLDANCGAVGDGCGSTISCGTCTGTGICGGGGAANVCWTPPVCTPKTCADYGANCGPVVDGCGGTIASCGDCAAGSVCGVGGKPNVCASSCVNLACDQVVCPSGGTTSISGYVYDPAGVNPLYNVFVYVPNAPTGSFVDGATCDKCADALSGNPLVTTLTDYKGHFSLTNMPVGTNIPVVIQTGKWRRQFTVNTTKCGDVAVSKTLTRFPRTQSEGDIPNIALSTGGLDPLECLLRKIGIDDSEFTNPGEGGRVNLFHGMPGEAATEAYSSSSSSPSAGESFPDSSTLWASDSSLEAYDVVLLACEGAEYGDPSTTTGESGLAGTKPASSLQSMVDYVNAGGRVFASHYHYYWMSASPDSGWNGLASWNSGTDSEDYELLQLKSKTSSGYSSTVPEEIVTSFSKGSALASWLQNIDPKTTLGSLAVSNAKNSIYNLTDTTDATEWIYAQNQYDEFDTPPDDFYFGSDYGTYEKVSHATEYFSFNAPIGVDADSQCGRFVFSDIHVASDDTTGEDFPEGCTATSLTPQQQALEFLIFDLSSRVCSTTTAPTCPPQTCASQGVECGPASDGCSALLDCGSCPSGETCGGGGTAGKCGTFACTPSTCASVGYTCGSTGDGCGNILDCGVCTAPATCGGGGVVGTCGAPSCTPKTCADEGVECGATGDGCGNPLDCGTCTAPATCGGGGVSGKCGVVTCTPLTCGTKCGEQGDGCGNVLNCTPCTGGTCVPTTCAAANANCGQIGDGCGNLLTCGTCATGQTCGGGGTPYQCGGGIH